MNPCLTLTRSTLPLRQMKIAALIFLFCLIGLSMGAPSANAQAPAAPTNLFAVAANQRVNLSWTAVSGATSYTLYRGTASGGPYSTTVISGLAATNYSNAPLTNGTPYYYIVTATGAGGTSGNSNQASATPGAAPAAPTNLVATGQSGQITLSWTPVTGAVGYNIYRWNPANPQSYAPTYSGVTSDPYVDSGLTNGTTYYYLVSAVGSNGAESAQTGPVNAQPAAQPTGLSARAGNTQITLSWSSPLGAVRTNIYRGTTSGGEGTTPIATVTDHSLTYTDSGLTNGQIYYYQVSGANGAGGYGYGESTRSAEASATPMPPLPVAPTGLDALAGNHQVLLSWSSAANATSYNVKRSSSYGQGYVTIASPAGNTYTDPNVLNGYTYYYIVTGVDITGEGANSNQVDATPQASSASNNLAAIADSFNSQGAPTVNNGYNSTLYTGSTEGSRQISYYKFDLSGAAGAITSARLNLSGGFHNVGNPSITSDNFSAYGVTDNSWTELGITWNNQPALGSLLSTTSLTTTGAIYSWDVTSFVQSQQASGAGQVSLAVAQTTTPTVNNYATFSSRETTSWPTLVVTVGGPTAPQLTATGGSKQVNLSWLNVPGAMSYRLMRSTTSGGPYTTVTNAGTLPSSTTSFVDAGLSDSTTFYYVLTATNSNGVGLNSNEASASTTPVSPINLVATAISDKQVSLNWNSVASASGYNIYRSTVSGSNYTLVSSAAVAGTSYSDMTVLGNTTYYYVVNAINSGGASGYSNQASVTTPPAAPINLTATPGINRVDLVWGASSGTSINYNVYRSTVSGGPYTLLTTTATANTFFTDSQGLTNGIAYFYVVAASSTNGKSVYSNEATATLQSTLLTGIIVTSTTVGGTNGYVSVQLLNPSPPSGLTISLMSDSNAASVPSSVYVAAGNYSSNSVPITTVPVVADTTVHISAVFNGVTKVGSIIITIPNVSNITVNPSKVIGGNPLTGTVILDGQVVSSNYVISLSSDCPNVQVPKTVSVLAGNNMATFNINSSPPQDDVIATISAGTSTFKSTTITVTAPVIGALDLLPSNIASGNSTIGKLTLSAPALNGGLNIKLSTSNTNISIPATVLIPMGKDTAQFIVTTIDTLQPGLATITANVKNTTIGRVLSMSPFALTANLKGIATSSSDIQLNWTASGSATNYQLERSIDGVANWLLLDPKGNSYFHDANLLPATTYYYRVLSLSLSGASGYSKSISISTPPIGALGLVAASGDGQITLSWQAQDNRLKYEIMQGSSTGGPYHIIDQNIMGNQYTDINLINGKQYFYVIMGVASGVEGPQSSEAFATPHSTGSAPSSGVINDSTAGFLYGTTSIGGPFLSGTIFRINSLGIFENMFSFDPIDLYGVNVSGSNPINLLTEGLDNNIYGSTSAGGSTRTGTIFKMSMSGNLSSLSSISCSHLLGGTDGNFYGTTANGGVNNNGSIFKIDILGNLTTLYSFSSYSGYSNTDGAQPLQGVVRDNSGNIYGVTNSGGTNGTGTIFKLDSTGNLTVLLSFDALTDFGINYSGVSPNELMLSGDGILYGSTREGGDQDSGVLYKITTNGQYTRLYSFSGYDDYGINHDGCNPTRLIQGTDGNFYGLATNGGINDDGTAYSISPSGTFTSLHSFEYNEGVNPQDGLTVIDANFLSGTASSGGPHAGGTVFKIDIFGNVTVIYGFAAPSL